MKCCIAWLAVLCAGVALAAGEASALKSLTAKSGDATITVGVADATIRVGQPLVVDFTLDRPADVSVLVPQIKNSFGAWDVRASVSLPTSKDQPNRLVERITLVTFESGEVPVPSMAFTLRAADGNETTLASPALAITVASLLSDGFDPERIRDVKGVVDIPLPARWPWFVAFAVLVALLSLLIVHWWKGRQARPVVIEPAHLRAIRELDDLASQQLPHNGKVLDFYVQLSDTVRRYVENRFAINAPDQTTKEFLQAARHHPLIREDHQRMLAAFLRAADMVKFAAQRPAPSECDRGLDAARGFVLESAPEPSDDDAEPESLDATASQESPR